MTRSSDFAPDVSLANEPARSRLVLALRGFWPAVKSHAMSGIFALSVLAAPNAAEAVSFSGATVTMANARANITSADLNHDGVLDLALADERNSHNVTVFIGSGTGSFAAGVNYVMDATTVTPTQVVFADLNGDTYPDMIVSHKGTGATYVTVRLGAGDGTFGANTNFSSGGTTAFSLGAGDFDNDGKVDVLVANWSDSTVSVLLGNGNGTLQAPTTYSTNPGAAGEIDPSAVVLGDFNHDGKLDVAVANAGSIPVSHSSTVAVFLGNGDGTLQTAVLYTVGQDPRWLTTGDFNGDGHLDLATSNYTSQTVSVLLGNGNGTFQTKVDYAAASVPSGITTGDLNGDGFLDLAVANLALSPNDKVSVFLGNGDGTFQAKTDLTGVSTVQPNHLVIGDLDGDGRPDIAVSNYYASGPPNLARLLNTSTFPVNSVATTAGSPQSTSTSSAFATALTVVVRDVSSNPLSGIGVTFTAPASGASGTFTGGGRSVTVPTNGSGVATAPTFTANSTGGAYNVVASVASRTATFVLTNVSATPPAFTSAAPAGGTFAVAYTHTVTASGTPAPTFSVTSGALPTGLSLDGTTGAVSGTPSAGGTFTGVITASNGASPNATQAFSIAIAPASQTITFGALGGKTYGNAPFALGATASSGLTPTYSIVSGPATVSSGTVTITGVGTVAVRASQAGNANYNAAADVDQSFAVAMANQSITFGVLSGRTYGDVPFVLSASASSGLSPTFSIVSGPATVSGSTVTMTGAGAVVVRAAQAGNANYNAAANVDQGFTVAKASQSISFGALSGVTYGNVPFTVSATATSGLATTFSIVSGSATLSGNTVTITGTGTVVVRASQTGNGNFNGAADVDQSFTVGKANQAITFGALAGKTYGTSPFAVAATADSGLPVSFSVVSGPATISGSTVTITAPGTVTIRAAQAGDANTNAAANVDRSFAVAKATAVVTLSNLVQTADGTPKSIAVTTVPAGLTSTVTYGGSATAPSAVGSFAVIATVTDANYQGTASGTLTLGSAAPSTSAPVIAQQPASITVDAGANATFSVSASGAPDPTYQWNFNGAPLAGATGSVLVLTKVEPGQAGNYAVTATNSAGAVTSSAATLTVNGLADASESQVYFGALGSDGQFAAEFHGNQGTVLGYLQAGKQGFASAFTLETDGHFRTSAAVSATTGAPIVGLADTTGTDLVFSGRIVNGNLLGQVENTGMSFALAAEPSSGPATNYAGYYDAALLNAATGSSNWIVSARGPFMLVTRTASRMSVASGLVGSDGQMQVLLGNGESMTGAMVSSGQISATQKASSGGGGSFAGLKATVTRTDRLVNVSSRAAAGTGEKTVIAGFVITGTAPKTVLLRAVGPALEGLGVQGALENPMLRLFRGEVLLDSNDDWGSAADPSLVAKLSARVGAFPLGVGSKDAALVTTLPAGAYTMQISGNGANNAGATLAEIYDASENPGSETQSIANISTRGEVLAGDGVLIAGFVVTGNAPKKVLVRAVGPSLARLGLAGTLADPRVSLFNGAQIVASNDNWSASGDAALVAAAGSQVGAFALEAGSKDAAILITLAPGTYTVQAAGMDGATGLALIEVYSVP